jgi:hypothetical protein
MSLFDSKGERPSCSDGSQYFASGPPLGAAGVVAIIVAVFNRQACSRYVSLRWDGQSFSVFEGLYRAAEATASTFQR